MKNEELKINSVLCFLFSVFCLVGCSQPLRTLMAVGAEQKAQQKFVSQEEIRFNDLWRDAKEGVIHNGRTQKEIIARYGEPVLKTGQGFLYRNPVSFFDAQKVYMDFNEQGVLKAVRIQESDAQ